MKKTLICLLFVSPYVAAQELKPQCVDYADALISGRAIPCGFLQICNADELAQRMAKKGITCDPIGPYVELAKIRIQTRAMQPAPEPPTYHPILLPPPVFRQPQQTTCHTDDYGNTRCTTTGG